MEEKAIREDTTNSKSCGGRDLTKGPLSVERSQPPASSSMTSPKSRGIKTSKGTTLVGN